MIAISGKKLWGTSLLTLATMLGAASLHGQSCNYYVSTSGSNSNVGTPVANAFATLQGAHDYLLNNPSTVGLRSRPITVCVESGDYYADDLYNSSGVYQADGIQYPGSQHDVLRISLAGTPGNVVTFTPDQYAYVTIHQTGWQAVEFAPSAAYVTFTGFVVEGQNWNIYATKDYTTNNLYNTATNRYTNGGPNAWAFYDGNCIAVVGNYAPGTNGGPPTGVPNNITISNNQIYACGGGGIATSQADYVTITGNTVDECSWFSIYGTSGISLLDSVNSDSDTNTGTPYKNFVTGNYLYGNAEYVPWEGANGGTSPQITDGEAIIIDTNLNSWGSQNPVIPNGPLPPYAGRTLVANNIIWGNGSSAVEVYESAHVDVEGNSTYNDDQNNAEPGRGEVAVSYASDVTVANNVLYGPTPISGGNLIQITGTQGQFNPGWAWLANNVYYAGLGVPVPYPNTIPGFYEPLNEATGQVETEQILDPGYVDPTAAQPDLRVTNSTAAANGCANGNAPCFAPATDILGFPRAYPYASGAYATTSQ
jgi:hypothetical protein